MSRIKARASTHITTSTAARRTNGAPRLTSWARNPSLIHRSTFPTPVKHLPAGEDRLELAREAGGVQRVDEPCLGRAREGEAEPRSSETAAHSQKGASSPTGGRRAPWSTATVTSRHERAPATHMSATIPVGTSNMTMPAVKKALAANASRLLSPASRRKIVLMPQIREAARVSRAGARSTSA